MYLVDAHARNGWLNAPSGRHSHVGRSVSVAPSHRATAMGHPSHRHKYRKVRTAIVHPFLALAHASMDHLAGGEPSSEAPRIFGFVGTIDNYCSH